MKFGYAIVYVHDVAASLSFIEKAFGFERRCLHESGTYGELQTGETLLAFAAHQLGESNLPTGYVKADETENPLGIEIAFVTDDVSAAHTKAMAAGASEVAKPRLKPWGQTVSYLRCPDGLLIELCSPMG